MSERDGFLLGVDLGAGSLKASIIDARGQLLGEASSPVTTQTPQFGWSEQDPEDWYRAFCAAAPEALARAELAAGDLTAIGFSAGAHSFVLLDADDSVVRPAIMWSDQRSRVESEALHERAGETIIAASLNRVNPGWTLAMLAWLQTHEPEALTRARRLFLAKDYLRYRVTGDWHSDFSDAVGALMADNKTRGWSAEICALIDWPMERLPPLAEPCDVVGKVTARAAAESGLAEGIPVVCGSNDTTVEFYGAGAIRAGQAAIKLATAAVFYTAVDHPSVHPPISCYPHIISGMYYTATGTNSCASAHRWLRDEFFSPFAAGGGLSGLAGLQGGETFAAMDAMAGEAPPGAEGLIFHPYLQGERGPYWDPLLRADFIGITLRHKRRHFVRALYEGIAFSVRDLLEAAQAEGLTFDEIFLIGGGARSALWRQILSDVIGMEVKRPGNGDASFGAALIAGVGAGIFADEREAVERCVTLGDSCQPDSTRHAFYSQLFEVYKEAQKALAPLNHRLHALCTD